MILAIMLVLVLIATPSKPNVNNFNKNEFTIYDFTGHKNLKDYDEI